MPICNLAALEEAMVECWTDLLALPLARDIKNILISGDRRLYAIWLIQVAHLTRHTSSHQALVGTRISEISLPYMKFCYEHAAEEVGHEMMALNDLRKLGVRIKDVMSLPPPLPATEKLTTYLYDAATKLHPATRLGFSYWAEKCYPFVAEMARGAQTSMGLGDSQMTFFVSHAKIDEKHARDVEKIIEIVCQSIDAWQAVMAGMTSSLNMVIEIFSEIHELASHLSANPVYHQFLTPVEGPKSAVAAQLF